MFYADLHLHSKFSRATSRDADLEHMAIWARKKGVAVLGTGDFTHPGWLAEIKQKLEPAEPGLFRLRSDLERSLERAAQPGAGQPVRFMLQVEISTIYKKGDRTRKVHHVIYVPGLAEAERLIAKLSRIGNLQSDGRPILGLDSRHLLEIALECGDGCFLVPAHIWTPWFAVLGSKSGFDSVEECFGDLACELFALETGLSSDPPMNWRLSVLDRYALVSNSDAHSPSKIGREACVFDTELDYFAMRRALRTRGGYAGTVEFFPEEGKYHFDGHRKCAVCLSPAQTRRHRGLCPVCGKKLTVGVMNRVESLADRPDGFRPEGAGRFRSLIPLAEVIAEIRGVGEKSKQVQAAYETLVAKVGPELYVLEQAPLEQIRRAAAPLVAEAIERMRAGRVIRQAGYDGQYGTIRLFEADELRRHGHRSLLFELPGEDQQPGAAIGTHRVGEPTGAECPPVSPAAARAAELGPGYEDRDASAAVAADASGRQPMAVRPGPSAAGGPARPAQPPSPGQTLFDGLDADQRLAAETVGGPLLVVAGPGTGKTHTLSFRLANLIANHGVRPEQCLTITFTRRAAGELGERLAVLLGPAAERVPVMTFHGLGLSILRENASRAGLAADFRVAGDAERRRLLVQRMGFSLRQAGQALRQLSHFKRHRAADTADLDKQGLIERYDRVLRQERLIDFDDLILLAADLLVADSRLAAQYRNRWPWVSIDEYQDIDQMQYRLVRQLTLPDGNVCAIGDPDQSIYGFRGSDPQIFLRFTEDYPGAMVVRLTRNYRSSQVIVDAAAQAIAPSRLWDDRALEALWAGGQRIEIQSCPTERAEAEYVVHTIERLIGGSTFFSMDSGRVESDEGESLSFADMAVLYRVASQAEPLAEALRRSGIPFQKRSHGRLADEPAVAAIIQHMGEAAQRRRPAARTDTPELLKRAAEAVWDEHPDAADYLELLYPLAERWGHCPGRFLTELAMGLEVDLWDRRADRVSLLTLHAAKGLEFAAVFLVGCEDGLLPLRWGSAKAAEEAEERRLFFVGMTRAKRWLFLSRAERRQWQGAVRRLPPSPFLEQIEQELVRRGARTGPRRRKAATQDQLELF